MRDPTCSDPAQAFNFRIWTAHLQGYKRLMPKIKLCGSVLAITAYLIAEAHAAAPMVLGEFSCATSLDDVYSLQLTDGRVRINNFTLSENKSWSAKDVMVLNLSASGSNRTEKPIYLSIEAVGYDSNNGVVFAVTAEPSFSMIGKGKTETIHGDIYVAPNTLQKASRICVRVTGEF